MLWFILVPIVVIVVVHDVGGECGIYNGLVALWQPISKRLQPGRRAVEAAVRLDSQPG